MDERDKLKEQTSGPTLNIPLGALSNEDRESYLKSVQEARTDGRLSDLLAHALEAHFGGTTGTQIQTYPQEGRRIEDGVDQMDAEEQAEEFVASVEGRDQEERISTEDTSNAEGDQMMRFEDFVICSKCTMEVRPSGSINYPGSYYCTCKDDKNINDELVVRNDGSISDEEGGVEEEVAGVDGFGGEGTGEEEMEEDDFGREMSLDTPTGNASSVKEGFTILSNIKSAEYTFKNVDEASAHLLTAKHKVEVENDDWREVEKDQFQWFVKLFKAMITLPKDAADTDANSFRTIQTKGFTQEHIEASVWAIIARTLFIHKYGSELQAKFQLDGQSIDQLKASDRLKTLVKLLYRKKNVVKDVLDGWKFRAVVDQPDRRLKRAENTEETNKHKYEKLKRLQAENERLKSSQSRSASTAPASSSDTEQDTSARTSSAAPSSSNSQSTRTGAHASTSSDDEDDGEESMQDEEDDGMEDMISDGWQGGSSDPAPEDFAGETRIQNSNEEVAEAGELTRPATTQAGKKRKREAPASRSEGGGNEDVAEAGGSTRSATTKAGKKRKGKTPEWMSPATTKAGKKRKGKTPASRGECGGKSTRKSLRPRKPKQSRT